MIEEALLVRLERRARGGLGLPVEGARVAGDVGGLQRGIEIVMDDLEGAGIGVVDADLLGRERVLQHLHLDALIGERARGIEAERLEVARQHLHRGDPALLHGGDEIGAGGEREIVSAPQAEALGVGEVADGGGSRGRHVDDARVGQRVLELEAREALLRGRAVADGGGLARGVAHGVRLVEDDHAVEACPGLRSGAGAQPIDDLGQARGLALALGRAQRGVGGEENALAERDGPALPEAALRHDEQLLLSQRGPVALGVLDQLVGLGDPERAAAALEPVVEQDARGLAALPRPGAVAQEPAAPKRDGVRVVVARGGHGIEALIDRPASGEMPGMGLARVDDALDLGVGEQAFGDDALGQMRPVAGLGRPHRRHGGRLHELGWMRLGALDADGLDLVGLVEAVAELPR